MSPQISEKWPIDWDILAQTAGRNAKKLLPDLVDIYIEDAVMLMGLIVDGDLEKKGYAAHRFYGNSASLGVTSIADLMQQLQTAVKQDDLDHISQIISQIETEYSRVEPALKQLVEQ